MASTDGTYLINGALTSPNRPLSFREDIASKTIGGLAAQLEETKALINNPPQGPIGQFFHRDSLADFHSAAGDLEFSLANTNKRAVPVLTQGSFQGENAERFNNALDLVRLMTRVSSIKNQVHTMADASTEIFNVLKTKASILLKPLLSDTPAAQEALASIGESIRDDLPVERRANPTQFIRDLAA